MGKALQRLKYTEEIRIRVRQPVLFLTDCEEQMFMKRPGYLTTDAGQAYIITAQDIKDMIVFMSRYSLFAFEQELRGGFITLEGGHRAGLSGQAVLQGVELATIRNISCINIRISHEKKGCAGELVPHLYRYQEGRPAGIYNTLLVSAPGKGKTTLLRDLIRLLSDGTTGHPGMKVSVVDERSEIAACCRGVPQNDVGMRTDVLDGCPKSAGMMLLIRTMSPQVVAVDELGSKEDVQAVAYAIHCGCSILGSAHAGTLEELMEKPALRELAVQQYFDRYLVIGQGRDRERIYRLYNAERELLYTGSH